MITDPNLTSARSRLRSVLCLLLFVAAGVAVAGAIRSSRAIGQGGSASSEVYGKRIAEGANVRQQSRVAGQRVEDNAFHRKIAPWVIEHTAHDQQADFFVVLADQADLSGATALATKAQKGRYVHDALLTKSQTTQRPILQWLRERSIEHRSFYIVNAILVKGSRDIAEALSARRDVARLEGNP